MVTADDLLLNIGPTRLAQVAIERGIDRYPDGLSYAVPEDLGGLHPGDRVLVPLGRGDVPTPGWVLSLHTDPPADAQGRKVDPFKVKSIIRKDESGVRLPAQSLLLAEWISDYYACPIGMTLASMLPAAVRKGTGRVTQHLVAPSATAPDPKDLPPRFGRGRKRVLEALQLLEDHELPIEIGALAEKAGLKSKAPVKALLEAGHLIGSTRSNVQAAWLERSKSLATDAAEITPNLEQQTAVEGIGSTIKEGFSRHLLYGVTGSGKTEVYIRLIRQVIESGAVALMLVPEIALTPQTASRLFARFPTQQIALLHSGLTQAQRNQQWTMVAEGKVQIVLGARSAVFAPIPDGRLGLVIVDEEHDSSYKQDQAPRYHGRDVAIRRAQLAECPIVLGSATPSLETWHNAVDLGRVQIHRLPNRAPGLSLPKVDIVDFAQEQRRWQDRRIHLLGPRLAQALQETAKQGDQAILLLNRRGYASYIACPDARCGWVMQCEQCDAGMVNHRAPGRGSGSHHDFVRCHHCLTEQRLPTQCPLCSRKITVFGLGTQRVEEEIQRLLQDILEPRAIKRVDSDSMRGSDDFHETLDRFARGDIRVLMGTQMIAKGLDFPGVRLVGVINADTALNLPDFRATERTFQLVSQVTGRCGRGARSGRAIIQTFQPDAPAIVMAAQHDFESFAEGELAERVRFRLPPIRRMARLVVRESGEDRCRAQSAELVARLRPLLTPGVELGDPEPCAIGRIGGRHRIQILVLAEDPRQLRAFLLEGRKRGALTPGESVAIDVDPTGLL
ncbi:MAG: primosomal protein N' [Planctomycetes bacterium TMED75]|nr:primosomal protein N' [Planctomycetaceae bacterium]OUU91561.1 MAG: primosomal protein N' [Planctomycetes bacterium TMED75]